MLFLLVKFAEFFSNLNIFIKMEPLSQQNMKTNAEKSFETTDSQQNNVGSLFGTYADSPQNLKTDRSLFGTNIPSTPLINNILPALHSNHAMIKYSARLNSFEKWPRQIAQKPDAMASAGFYYTKVGDGVRCFCCGLGLINWERNDNIIFEHKKHAPYCKFVEMVYDI